MTDLELLKSRQSIRKYTNEIVPQETLNSIMELTKLAPSWCNFQIARYTFVSNQDKISAIMNDGVHNFNYNMKTLKYAKNVAILSYVTGKSGRLDLSKTEYTTNKASEWEMFDAGISCQTFCLAAHSQGIGTCVMGVIDDKQIARIINLPENETVAAIITYGYPDEIPQKTSRKDISLTTRTIQ